MENRFPGPKSAVFKGSLGAHTLINAAVSLPAQSSLAQLHLSRVALLQTPFPATLILIVHSVPASQKLSTSTSRAWLSNLAQPSPGAVAHTAQDPSQTPAQPGNCPAHIPLPAPWTTGQRETSCFGSAQHTLGWNMSVTVNLSWLTSAL